ncbi:hypothetical protein [Micromonospora sp. NPDC049645]|uniref:hypothetical protein n=1 Tax=Micromonospora sp. NPDC049645 TaxID=3155508 RepID=UPI003437B312
MIGYSVTLPWQFAADLSESSSDDIFTPTGVLIGLPLLVAWTIALPLAGLSYYRRTRPPGPARRRWSASLDDRPAPPSGWPRIADGRQATSETRPLSRS